MIKETLRVSVIIPSYNQKEYIDKAINFYNNPHELKIIENFEIQESEDFEVDEDENTLSILNRYIDDSEFDFDKSIIKNILQDLYQQASQVE